MKKITIPATVVAKVCGYFVARDKEGLLFVLAIDNAKDIKIGDKIETEPVSDDLPNGQKMVAKVFFPHYVAVMENATEAVQIVCRVNQDLVLCRSGKQDVFVQCSADQQIQAQAVLSMLIGTRGDGNDRPFLECEDGQMLPVCKGHNEIFLQIYRQV